MKRRATQRPSWSAAGALLGLVAFAGCQSSKLPAGIEGLEYEGNRAFETTALAEVVDREFLASELNGDESYYDCQFLKFFARLRRKEQSCLVPVVARQLVPHRNRSRQV